MDLDLIPPRYVFVIDTDSYAGDFLYELCSFCTGYRDPRFPVAKTDIDEAQVLMFENKFFYLKSETPFCLWKGKDNDGFNSAGIMFEEKPTSEEIKLITSKADQFSLKSNFCIIGFRFLRIEIIEHEEKM